MMKISRQFRLVPRILFLAFFSLVSCASAQKEFEDLQQGFETKNEQQFLKSFPENFTQLVYTFGEKDSEETPVVEREAFSYVNYWFELLAKESNSEFENKLIDICVDGSWHDGVIAHFQERTINHLKKTGHYQLIDNLDSEKAHSVLMFLLDAPEPAYDQEFVSSLSKEKREIVYAIFTDDFNWPFDESSAVESNEIYRYLNDEAYFSRNIDINLDGILDKIVCSQPYEGEELILFVKNDDSFERVLTTLNFSADGGNQVDDILQTETGFVIKTAFPDGGIFLADFYISYEFDHWFIKHVIYTTKSDNSKDALLYVCDLEHNVDLENYDVYSQIRECPEDDQREKLCTKKKL